MVKVQDDVSGFKKLGDVAYALATEVSQQSARCTWVLNKFVKRIEIDKKTIKVSIDITALHHLLVPDVPDTSQFANDDQIAELIITGQILRCGKQVRLVIGGDSECNIKTDTRLVREIVQARKWFDDLVEGRASSIAELARRSGFNAAHVSRRISLAFLAPDITEHIIAGSQPLTLTPERLKQVCPLPATWDDQRALLLD